MKWREKRGKTPISSLFNVRMGIVGMGIVCRHDMFRDVTLIGYAGDKIVHEVIMGELSDNALLMIRNTFNVHHGFEPDDKDIRDAVRTLALENCFDPILDMLTEAQGNWDGKKRLDTWTVDYLGCKDTPLTRAIGRKVLVAAARRARKPGCKFDTITVLEGLEGIMKSLAISTLAGDDFFSDQSILGARDKEVQEQLAGIWMHESADLSGMKKADVEHVKAFASRQWDRARPAYGHVLVKKPRRGIKFGTTNDDVYLQSQTGNRRFWPLLCGEIDIEGLRRDRLQLLGEAAKYESEGESVVLDEVLWPDAKIEQEKRRVRHPWEDILDNIPPETFGYGTQGIQITTQIVHHEDGGVGLHLEKVSSAVLLEHVLRVPIGQQQRHHTMQLATIMKLLGWKRPDGGQVTIGKGTSSLRVRGYHRLVEGPVPSQDDELPS